MIRASFLLCTALVLGQAQANQGGTCRADPLNPRVSASRLDARLYTEARNSSVDHAKSVADALRRHLLGAISDRLPPGKHMGVRLMDVDLSESTMTGNRRQAGAGVKITLDFQIKDAAGNIQEQGQVELTGAVPREHARALQDDALFVEKRMIDAWLDQLLGPSQEFPETPATSWEPWRGWRAR